MDIALSIVQTMTVTIALKYNMRYLLYLCLTTMRFQNASVVRLGLEDLFFKYGVGIS